MIRKIAMLMLCGVLLSTQSKAQQLITNVQGRQLESLNGKWDAIIDWYDEGRRSKFYLNKKPLGKTDFFEYSFDGALKLNVPGDWNSQVTEIKYYEGTVWYARKFNVEKQLSKRWFLHFGAVSQRCRIYLNGQEIGQHEGGFTPFQFEVTGLIKDSSNFLAVEVNNTRRSDAIPAMVFDWWNYGGITRDVSLINIPKQFVSDYFIALNKYKTDQIDARIQLSDSLAGQKVMFKIPELNVNEQLLTDNAGLAVGSFKVRNLTRWSPQEPKLYDVQIVSLTDQVKDLIGFRNLYVRGEDIFLNDRPLFVKAISFHEEIPQRKGRAFSQSDAAMLLSEAKALGCNLVRLAHYPQNEAIVRMAEQMGIMLWQEIPVWGGAMDFGADTRTRADQMIYEMVSRDKNRCAVTFWGVANETLPGVARNDFLRHLITTCKTIDSTRLITAACNLVRFDNEEKKFVLRDSFIKELDVVTVNMYLGWYNKWPVSPAQTKWEVAPGQPLIVSEFGGEALLGQKGNNDIVSSWSEDYQARLYNDNLTMFSNISNLRGISPWVLFDFRSPIRFHPANQDGWNRKGLVSDQGIRKKAWYLIQDYYNNIPTFSPSKLRK